MYRRARPRRQVAAQDTIDVSDAERTSIMRSMLELRLGTQLANLVAQFDAGDLPNIRAMVSQALDKFKADAGICGIDFIQDDIGDLLQEEVDNLRSAFRGRRGSSLVIEGVAQATAAGMNPQIGQTPNQLSPQLDRILTDKLHQRRAAGNSSVSDWIETRLLPALNGVEFRVIGGNYAVPHGRTRMDTLRASYAA